MKERVVVAMSGGVDSSVTAALLKREGYEVIGVTMQIWPSKKEDEEAERFGGCCGLGAVEDAKRVAERLNIPHYVLNFREIFEKKVIANFCSEYKEGRTPNPCIRCNQYIKFGVLLKQAKELDAEYIATGHYARIEYNKDASAKGGELCYSSASLVDEASETRRHNKKKKRYFLKKGIDPKKDQSYVLYVMTQEQLKHTLMPLGTLTKEKVREIARELKLPVASKPESQEICFIPDADYRRFLKTQITADKLKEGLIVDKKGKVLGRHKGIAFYTIGQRRGLGIATGKPLYIIAINKDKNVLVVGGEEETLQDRLIAGDVNWIAFDKLKKPIRAKAKIRYRHREAEAKITPLGDEKVEVRFKRPQRAITPGQAVVFYDKDILIGGGTIEKR